jgi:hypothetical protein
VPPVEPRRGRAAGRNLPSAICDLKSSEAWSLAQGFEEALSIRVIPEDGFASVPAIHRMVSRAFAFNPQRSRDGRKVPETERMWQ